MRHGWSALKLLILTICGAIALTSGAQSVEPARPGKLIRMAAPWESEIALCQHAVPVEHEALGGVRCEDCNNGCGEATWNAWQPIPWQAFAHGEYIGPHRTEHVPEYRLRVDDQLQFVYRLTREETNTPYELNVGDEIKVES